MLRCNLPPALSAEKPGPFTCHCGNTGVERTPNNSQHTKLTLEKKILSPLLPGFELAAFRSRVRRSNQQAIPAPHGVIQFYQYSDAISVGSDGQITFSTRKGDTVLLQCHAVSYSVQTPPLNKVYRVLPIQRRYFSGSLISISTL